MSLSFESESIYLSGKNLDACVDRSRKKSEHLRPGIEPVMAAVGSMRQFLNSGRDSIENKMASHDLAEDGSMDILRFGETKEETDAKGYANAGQNSYIISPLDQKDKYSDDYHDCTGFVGTGIDKSTGEKISFLSHQNPYFFINDQERRFESDFQEKLHELRDRCEPGTVDAVIFGGTYQTDEQTKNVYRESINFLGKITQDILEFEPVVIVGPKIADDFRKDAAYFSNQTKHLYIMRSEIGIPSTESFLPSEIKEKEKKWRLNES